MKKIICVSMAAILILLSATACSQSSHVFIGRVETFENSIWQVSYNKFDGVYQREIRPGNSGECVFTVTVVSEAGQLGLTITDKDGTVIYSEAALSSSIFDIKVEGGTTYIVKFQGENHRGSFQVKWK